MAAEINGGNPVYLRGIWTVSTIQAKFDEFVSEYGRADHPVIDLSQVEECDLTFLQMLVAARKSALADGKTLVLKVPAGGALHEMLQRAGFLQDPAERRFWLGEEVAV